MIWYKIWLVEESAAIISICRHLLCTPYSGGFSRFLPQGFSGFSPTYGAVRQIRSSAEVAAFSLYSNAKIKTLQKQYFNKTLVERKFKVHVFLSFLASTSDDKSLVGW